MNEKIKKFTDPVKELWGRSSKKAKIIFFSVLGALAIVAVSLGIALNTQPYVILYPGMDHDEAVQVMTELKNRDVAYKEDNGTISVPKDQEDSLRMELANLGYPKSAPNYDFFTNNIDVMTTDFEKKTIEKYQLNQRLEAVIKTLDPIQNANVTISVPDDSGYVWDENKKETTASVTLTLKQDKKLDAASIKGIKQLVAKSVPNLSTENVVVIDAATGDEFTDEENTQTDVSQFKLEIEKQYEKDVTKKVQNQLRSVWGENNFSVAVKSTMDLDKKIKEITTYTPSEQGNNTGVLSEENTKKESTTAANGAGGAAGAETNAEQNTTTYPGITTDGNRIYSKDESSYKYLVSKVIEQIQGDSATLQDMTVSVTINQATMDQTQKDSLKEMVAFAAGVTPDKVSIYNAEFQRANVPTAASPITPMVLIIGGAVLALLLILLVVALLVARKRKQRMLELAGLAEEAQAARQQPEVFEEADEIPALEEDLIPEDEEYAEPEEEVPLVEDIESQRKAMSSTEQALQKEIQDFAGDNPEIVAQLIRTLLKGDETNG